VAVPVVTLLFIALNIVGFLVEVSMGPDVDVFLRRWGVVPADVLASPAAGVTLFTSIFLHLGWLHLAGNMLYLGVFGPRVERLVGSSRYLVIYLLSGLIGGLGYVIAQPTSQSPAVGASGAIAGLIAAHLVLFLHVVESAPTLVLLLLWLATQVFSSVASLTTSTGIAWWAHLGGFGTGVVLAPLLRKRRMAR
jgi:membrane associated rhomboid family serine protease